MINDPLGFLAGLATHGDIVDMKAGPTRVSVVCHPDLVDRMLRNEWGFDKGGEFVDRVREFLGNGLATCPRADHRRQRRLIQSAFHPARLPSYAGLMAEQIATETAEWVHGQLLDVAPAMTRIISQALTGCLFSKMESDTTTSVFIDTMDELMRLIIVRVLIPPWLDWAPMPAKRRFTRAVARLRELSAQIIAEHRQAAETDHGDLLSALLAARDEDGSALSDSELIDQITTLYSAGSESSATALAWAFHLLASHPEVEQRLHAELDTVLGGRPATYQDLPTLTYTQQAINETLRLYPPAWILTRNTTTDTDLGGHTIPAGRTVVYSAYLVHHQPDAHPDPETFNPNRWEGQSHTALGTTYIPFGAGARKCIGDTFSLTQTTLTLATIAAHWRLAPVPGRPVTPRIGASLAPRGLRLRLEQRHPTSP